MAVWCVLTFDSNLIADTCLILLMLNKQYPIGNILAIEVGISHDIDTLKIHDGLYHKVHAIYWLVCCKTVWFCAATDK